MGEKDKEGAVWRSKSQSSKQREVEYSAIETDCYTSEKEMYYSLQDFGSIFWILFSIYDLLTSLLR